MTGEQAARLLGWLRVAAGAGAWLTPGTTSRFLGFQSPREAPARFVLRLFGARDIALGAGVLGAPTAAEQDRWLVLGMAVDGMDAAACLVAGSRKQLRWPAAIMGATTACAALAVAQRARSG